MFNCFLRYRVVTAENVGLFMFVVSCVLNPSRECSVTLRLIQENGFIDHLLLLVGIFLVFVS